MTCDKPGGVFLQLLCNLLNLPDLIAGIFGFLHQMKTTDDQIRLFPVLVAEGVHDAEYPAVGAPGHQYSRFALTDHQKLFVYKIVALKQIALSDQNAFIG